jgi:4-hydroxy-tetrahydrodipicolinate synthase
VTNSWRGTFTALVTPFRGDGSVDFGALERLVDRQIDGGVEGIVPCGTTGESATLTNDEKLRVIEAAKKASRDRLLVMAGAGGNATDAVLRFARDAAGVGVDGLLSVVPYYNRPNQEGLYRHFATIADQVDVPVFVYNVPGRTGASLAPPTVSRLTAHGNIRGIKEASGDVTRVAEILENRPEGFRVLSGEDHLTLPIAALGGDGVVSVVSNEVPVLMSSMVREALAGRFEKARALHFRLLPLMRANFIDTNPIPVKAALAIMGLIEECYRLPLTPTAEAERQNMREVLEAMALIDPQREEVVATR